MFGYGVTKERQLSESVLKLALKYARLRLSKWNDLGYEDTVDYAFRRSDIHSRIAEALDCDRELVEEAFVKAAAPFDCKIIDGYLVDRSLKNDEDLAKIYDSFCNNLLEVALRENDEDRHPDRITKEQLDEISNVSLTIPNTVNFSV